RAPPLPKVPLPVAVMLRVWCGSRIRRMARTGARLRAPSRLRPSSSSSSSSGLCTEPRYRLRPRGREHHSLPLGTTGTAAAAYLRALPYSLRPRTTSSSSPPGLRRSTPSGTAASSCSFSPRTRGHRSITTTNTTTTRWGFSSTSSSSLLRSSSCPSQRRRL
ncbi:unnamed protein product, partial [Ectocarpus sp. 13 AM-2016]